jgi:hypothetical protein
MLTLRRNGAFDRGVSNGPLRIVSGPVDGDGLPL